MTGISLLENMALDLMNTYNRTYFEDRLKIKDPYVWTSESWKIANDFIYPYALKRNTINELY